MPRLIFNVHIPLLRITKPSVPFMGGHFWKLSFSTFNSLTLGAFVDHEASYEETAPVFFNFELDFDADWLVKDFSTTNSALECKVATNVEAFDRINTPIPLFFKQIHEHYIDPLWEILLLAAPTSHIVQPRHSITFINPEDTSVSFNFGKDSFPILSYRGDMDVEYIFKPEASGKPVDIESFYQLPDLSNLLLTIHQTPALDEALEAFKLASLPYLNRSEQLMITVAALESLILPDIYSGLKRNFSARIARLLASSEEEYEQLNKVCRKLYDYRSKAIHGKDTTALLDMAEESNHYYGCQLLSNCIISLSAKIAAGQELSDLIEALDADGPEDKIASLPGLHKEVVNGSPWRLLSHHLRRSMTMSADTKTETTKQVLTFWCPFIGLGGGRDLNVEFDGRRFGLTSLSGRDIISLEDKDIRRDFISQLGMIEHQVAALELSYEVTDADFHLEQSDAIYREQAEIRDLLTTGLRLAGFDAFTDPELLGVYTYHGMNRYRQPSVLRQSILTRMKQEPQGKVDESNVNVVQQSWHQLLTYYYQGRHEDIDHTLRLYRRIHEQEYIPFRSRAKILFATLESMLGRFRRWEDAVQLEDLIEALIGEQEASRWFKEKGRKTRNGVAHGNWESIKGKEWFIHALTMMDALIPEYLSFWMNLSDRNNRRPGRAFVKYAESLLGDV